MLQVQGCFIISATDVINFCFVHSGQQNVYITLAAPQTDIINVLQSCENLVKFLVSSEYPPYRCCMTNSS